MTKDEAMKLALEALEDMNCGWKYIRESHGDLYGVGWDRAQQKADDAIAALRQALEQPEQEPVAYTTRTGMRDGRLVPRPFQFGDTLPAVGSYCLVSGANCDIESDQHRGYSWRQVLGYSDDKEFVCLQTHKDSYACWPTVERLTNCWFAEIPHPIHPSSQPRQQAGEPAAVLAEREACAKVADRISDKYAFGYYGNEVDTADEISAAIRERMK